MNSLECPYCKKQALRVWEIFIFPSPFWIHRRCISCNRKVRFNFNLYFQIVLFIFLAVIIRKLIDFVISFDFFLFDALLYFLFILIPLLSGKKIILHADGDDVDGG